ncbi:MAG: hypothetical protein RJB38_2215 [Pseudomonadota bacterium]|jgi:DNA polymerase (family 10)
MSSKTASPMTPTSVNAVRLLEEIAHLMSLKGENPFKVRAFEKAAAILTGREDLAERARQGTLTELDGIGKGIAEVLTEFLITGVSKVKAELESTLPAGLLELTQIPGLGPKKAFQLIETLEISSVRELEYACQENRLLKIKGFGPKIQQKLLENIRFLQAATGQVRLDQVLEPAQHLLEEMRRLLKTRVECTGEVRRRCEVLHSVGLLIELSAAELVDGKPSSAAMKRISECLVAAKSASTGAPIGVPIELEFAEAKNWGTHWARGSSSAAHWSALFPEGSEPGAFRDEEALYASKKLPWIDPVLRETGHELELAARGVLHQVIQQDRIRGVFHFHTTRSDGAHSLEEMVRAAREWGYQYVGVSDHSQSAFYAQGLKEDELLAQEREVRAVQEKYPEVRIFWGIESDILADGSLDYPDHLLKHFDFVIASIHSRFQMDRETMTERVVQAIRHPQTRFIGHLTGRLLLGRKGYELDVERVIREAAKHDVAIELNAHPQRLDIDWRHGPLLKKAGALVSINPDAHEVAGFSDTEYGVWMARKALLFDESVVNAWDLRKVESWLKRK